MNPHQKQFVLTLLAYAVQRDISAEQLSRLSNIDLSALQSGTEVVTPKKINDLWANVVHLSRDQFFGLHLGETMQLAALGIVGELIKTSRNVGEGVTNAAAFGNLLTDAFTMRVSKTSKIFQITFEPNDVVRTSFPEMFRQMMDLSLIMSIHELDGLILKKVSPVKVTLPFEQSKLKEYTRTLRCEPVYGHEFKLEFDGVLWDEPIITANYQMQSSLLHFATESLKKHSNQPAVKERIMTLLLTRAYLGMPTIEEVASNFNISSRTLQRKLNEEGASYQQLCDEIRKSLAINYLNSGNYQMKEISIMLGYNEMSAFTRAFKRWTGNSPMKYQQALGHS